MTVRKFIAVSIPFALLACAGACSSVGGLIPVLRSVPPNSDQFGRRVLVIDGKWSAKAENHHVSDVFCKHMDAAASWKPVFSWNASCAVEMTWGILCLHWSDFCYPSDDSSVAAILDSNINMYYIEGSVWLGSRAPPEAQSSQAMHRSRGSIVS